MKRQTENDTQFNVVIVMALPMTGFNIKDHYWLTVDR